MSTNRRDFLRGSAAVLAASTLSLPALALPATETVANKIAGLMVSLLGGLRYELNDDLTRSHIRRFMYRRMEMFADAGDVYRFRVDCGTTNNPPRVVEEGCLYADVFYEERLTNNVVLVRTSIHPTGIVTQIKRDIPPWRI